LGRDLSAEVAELLGRLEEGADLRETLDEVLALLSERSRCESVGIRWKAGEDYPYFLTRGFGKDFEVVEGPLCSRDSAGLILRHPDGTPQLACVCGAVASGRKAALPQFTEAGSFWTNGTKILMDGPSSGEIGGIRLRGYCASVGYESIAVIPLRTDCGIYGVLQLNSRTPERFTEGLIAEYEAAAREIAAAVAGRMEQHSGRGQPA
jgi:hypothetical protein